MAFYSQGKEFLNLPEQVQKNIDDISDLQTSIATKQDSSTAVNDTNLKEKVEAVGSYDLGAVSVTSLTNTGNTTNTGTLDQEGDATFGSDIEVDGSATFNSPESLVFKTGSLDFSELTNFLSEYYTDLLIRRFESQTIAFSSSQGCEISARFSGFQKATRLYYTFAYADSSNSVTRFNHTIIIDSLPNVSNQNAWLYTFWGSKFTQITLRSTNYIGLSTFANSSALTTLALADGAVVTSAQSCDFMFSGCTSLQEVGAIDMSDMTSSYRMFSDCTSLKSVHMTHFKVSFDISASTQFEESDLVEIIGNLDTVTTAQTLTMGSTNLAKLTQDEILVATGKGWTLA